MKYFFCFPLLLMSASLSSNNLPKDFTAGYYQIVSNQRSMNIPRASFTIGERLIVWDKNDCRFNQEWKFEAQGRYYIIRSRLNELVLTANKSVVQQSTYNGNANQLWLIEESKNGYTIISKETGLVLTLGSTKPDNTELTLEEAKQTETQIWNFEPAGIEYIKADFNRVLSPNEMKTDVKYFFDKLGEVHVNPYAFVSKDSLEKRKQEILLTVSKPLKKYEFNRIISGLNGMFDGHTGINLFNHGYDSAYYYSFGGWFPYDVNYSENKISIKSEIDSLNNLEILSINDLPVTIICSEIEKRENLENRTCRNVKTELNFRAYLFSYFDLQPPFKTKVKRPGSKDTAIYHLTGLPFYLLPKGNTSSFTAYSFTEYTKDSIAIIEYNTCGIRDMTKFNNYIDSAFNVIKQDNIKYLFIDISRNGGGSTSTNDIFYANINHTSNPWSMNYVKKISLDSKMHYLSLSSSFSDEPYETRLAEFRLRAKHSTQDVIQLKEGKLYRKNFNYCTEEVKNKYSGNLYIIQSYFTYSAAMEMSAWFKYSKVGTLIGTETGGTTEVYIEGIPFTMPNSGINFRIADNYELYPGGDLKKGIMPDIDLGKDFYKPKYELNDLKQFIKRIKGDAQGTL